MANKKLDGKLLAKVNSLEKALIEERESGVTSDLVPLRLRGVIGQLHSMATVRKHISPEFHERLNQVGALRHG